MIKKQISRLLLISLLALPSAQAITIEEVKPSITDNIKEKLSSAKVWKSLGFGALSVGSFILGTAALFCSTQDLHTDKDSKVCKRTGSKTKCLVVAALSFLGAYKAGEYAYKNLTSDKANK